MGGPCSAYGGRREAHSGYWCGKPERKRPLGRPRRRWEDSFKLDLQEVGCGDIDWIKLAQSKDRLRSRVNAVTNLRIP